MPDIRGGIIPSDGSIRRFAELDLRGSYIPLHPSVTARNRALLRETAMRLGLAQEGETDDDC
ncbi:hypothetical protein [Microbacterium sp. GXS0129]|uniref:hypothetical protein n=1 Tax=Microbacterium sp. GXS0129 TaxID=3377836 RepID=UPI003839F730